MRNDHDSPHAALIATATAVGAKMASPYDATLRPEDVREARTPQVEDLPEIRLGEEGEAADLVLGDALGAGAMGVVHKAWQTALERDVAIKRLTEGRESEQGRRELLLEARLTGMLDHPNRSCVGGLAAATLRQLATDVAFMSTSSWDLQRGTTTPSALKVEVKQAAMQAASRCVLITTSSKYGTFGMYKIAGLEQFDAIISDDGLAHGPAESIRAHGVELMLASVDKPR